MKQDAWFKAMLAAAISLVAAGGTTASAADVTWDAANNNWTSTTLGGQAWANYDSAIFNTAGAHTITVGGGGVLIGKPDGNNKDALTISTGNYTFNGDPLLFQNANGPGGGDMNVIIGNNTTATFNNQLVSTNNAGSFRFLTQGDSTVVNLNGGLSSSHAVFLGQFNNSNINFNVGGGSNQSYTASDAFFVTSNVNVGNATLNVGYIRAWKNYLTVNDANAVLNVNHSGGNAIEAGQSNEAAAGIKIQNGTMNVTGGIAITNANRNAGDGGTVNGVGLLQVSGGTLNTLGDIALLKADKANAIGNGQYVQTGGTVNTRGIVSGISGNGTDVSDGAGSVGSINIQGGSLYIGSTGMQKTIYGPTTLNVNLSGGTIGATADWNSNMDMTLSNANGGVTFKTADASNNAHTITLNGVMSGSGPLKVSGAGTLLIQSLNSYSGGTFVGEGIVQTGAIGNFGTGDFTLTGTASLVLGNGSSIDDLADLSFASGSVINLNGNTETIAMLFSGSNYMGIGSWDATQLNTFFGGSNFTGAGFLNVTASVPEPSTWTLLGAGLVGVYFLRRRTAKQVA